MSNKKKFLFLSVATLINLVFAAMAVSPFVVGVQFVKIKKLETKLKQCVAIPEYCIEKSCRVLLKEAE